MNYIPKRVFLLDCGKYIELSYEEFCEKKEETEGFDAKNRKYILIQGMLLEVNEPAYREHYRICRRMRYLMEMEQKVQILSFEDCIEAGLEGSILSAETEKMPDAIAEGKDTIQRLRRAIDRLTNEERDLILALFFFHATQRNSRGGMASRRPPSASACSGFCRSCAESWNAHERRKIAAWGL